MMTKGQATIAAKALLAKMPKAKGWTVEVWENLGWHYRIRNKHVSVVEYGPGRYHATLHEEPDGCVTPPWHQGGVYDDPTTAVRLARMHLLAYRDAVDEVCDRVIDAVREVDSHPLDQKAQAYDRLDAWLKKNTRSISAGHIRRILEGRR